jgi:nucleotide-binding universal stress UspA family protein
MPKKILCAVDGSKASADAADCAVDLAKSSGAKLTFLNINVIPARSRRTYFWDAELLSASEAQAHKALNAAGKIAKAAKFDGFDCVEATGNNVADAIVAYADKNKSDHIVMGTATTNELARLFIGSVAMAVVSHAHCPVTVVK